MIAVARTFAAFGLVLGLGAFAYGCAVDAASDDGSTKSSAQEESRPVREDMKAPAPGQPPPEHTYPCGYCPEGLMLYQSGAEYYCCTHTESMDTVSCGAAARKTCYGEPTIGGNGCSTCSAFIKAHNVAGTP